MLMYEVTMTELSLQDLAINLDDVTELKDSRVFELVHKQTQYVRNEKDLV